MKKIVSILLLCCMVFSFTACSQLEKLENIELPPLPTQTPTPVVESTPEPEIVQEDDVVVEVYNEPECQIIVNTINTSIEEFDPAEGKELILSYSYDTPVIYIEGREEAAEKINGYIQLIDETHYTGNDHGLGIGTGGFNMMLEQAMDNFAYVTSSNVEGLSLEFTASRTADVARADDEILTLVYDDYYYTGGAHGIYFSRGYCFDTNTGEKLDIEKLSHDAEGFKNFLLDTMVAMVESDEDISMRIDENIVPADGRREAFAALLRDGSWYLDNNGICIFSDVYELGSYAAGEVIFNIPYEKLEGKIIDKYIPAARSGEAKLDICYLSELAEGSVEILDRIVLDEAGQEICISISGNAYDVNLSSVDYSYKFLETAQHWYASYMEDSAIQVLCSIPEGMPNLMISYLDSRGQRHSMLISQSGENGKLVLVDDSIEAVG